ncbi:cupin domain-containing protein [Mesorhizobium sp. M0684]|uniref:cupin domain-containing protein n=1 Tax=unclassified Mesorhizobium TaxID=325217 RepID=UPI00333636E2
MSRCGDVYENKVTGEYAVILRGTEDRGQGPGIAHLTARPGAAVVGEHFHPNLTERFTVLRGRLDACIAGKTLSLEPGQSATVEAGVAHDWWNSSKTEEAHVLVEVDRAPGADNVDPNRFELLIGMLFGLANAGKVDRKGRPSPLQAAVIAREFADVIVFTHPPPAFSEWRWRSWRHSAICSAIARSTRTTASRTGMSRRLLKSSLEQA